jgi:RarD protein
MNKNRAFSLVKLILSMVIFSTIGAVVRGVSFNSGFSAMVRGLVGAGCILIYMLLTKKKVDIGGIKKNLLPLLLSGGFIGVNWLLLFESYRYTTIATATVCYNIAPVFVIILTPFVLKARVPLKKWLCVMAAFVGIILVSDLISFGAGVAPIVGVLLSLSAALFYSCVTLINKKITGISSYDITVVQLLSASVVIAPYAFFVEEIRPEMFDTVSIILLLLLSVVHTGIAYVLYFSSVRELSSDTVAVFTYIDPIGAVLISVFAFNESMSPLGIVGAVIIFLAVFLSEFKLRKT